MALYKAAPCLAYGITYEKTVTGSPVAGNVAFACSNASSPIVSGDPIFCANVNGSTYSSYQYLGQCVSATTGSVTTTVPLESTPVNTLKLWKPTQSVIMRYGISPIDGQSHETIGGPFSIVSTGGSIYSFDLSNSAEIVRMEFASMQPQALRSFETFIDTYRRGGLDAFSLGWYDNKHESHRVVSAKIETRAMTQAQVSAVLLSLSIGFIVIADDYYCVT